MFLDNEESLGLSIHLPPFGALWTPVGSGVSGLDPMLQYFHDIAYSLIELRANIQKDNTPVAYRRKTSSPFKCLIGGKPFTCTTKAVSDTRRKRLVNKAVVQASYDIEEIVDGPLAHVCARPNSTRQTWGKLFYDIERMKAIWGSAFVYYELSNNRLWTIPFSRNQKAKYAANNMDIEKYCLNGKDYKPNEIIPFVCSNPGTPYRIERPISPLYASCKALYLNDKYFKFVARTFANGANPTLALKMLQQTTDENQKTVAADIKNNLTGEDDGSIPVYDGTKFELQSFAVPYKDLIGNTLQQDMIRKTVCNCFQVPPGIFDATSSK